MHELINIFKSLETLPLAFFGPIVSLAGLGVAALAIYVVHSALKSRARQ